MARRYDRSRWEKSSIINFRAQRVQRSDIDGDTRIYLLFSTLFGKVPSKKLCSKDPNGHHQVRDYKYMLQLLNHLVTTAPSWNDGFPEPGMTQNVPVRGKLAVEGV